MYWDTTIKGRIWFHVKNGKYNSVEDFRNFLKSNPTTIVYQSVTPRVETIDNTSIDLNTMSDITYITSDNNVKGNLSFTVAMNTGANLENNAIRLNAVERYTENNKDNKDRISKLEEGVVASSLNIIDIQKNVSKLNNDVSNEEYSDYSGLNITCNSSFDTRTKDMVIKGNTLQNIHPTSNYSFSTNIPSGDYTVSQGQNYCEVTINNYGTGNYYYVSAGEVNFPLLKPNTKYTLLAEATDGISPGIMTGSYLYPLTKGGTYFKNGVATIITNDLSNGFKGQVIYLSLKGDMTGQKQKVKNLMIFEGDLDIIPDTYFQGIRSVGDTEGDKYKIDYFSHGKNLCPINTFSTKSDRVVITKKPIRIKPNTFYAISSVSKGRLAVLLSDIYIENIENHDVLYANVVRDDRGTEIGCGGDGTVVFNSSRFRYAYITTWIYSPNGLDITGLMLEENNQVTEYEPYKTSYRNVLVHEPIRKVNNNLLDIIKNDGAQVKAFRTIGELILDGNEN